MFRLRARRLGATLALTAALVLAAACGDDNGTGSNNGDPIVASWQVTSFGDGTTDFIAAGMTMKITLKGDGTYAFVITDDQVGACDNPGANCTKNGTYSHTSNQVTIDPGSADGETTFSYVIAGNTMTWTGTIETTAVTIVMTKTN